MARKNLSKYQADVVSRYYDNLEAIMLTKLSEMVTELYLAKSSSEKKQLWKRVHKAMKNLKIKPAIISHIINEQNVEILAKNLEDWIDGKR